jgi:hypothetical protein
MTRESPSDATDETRRALPVERAFVVQLRPEALPEEGLLVGRVEHVVSGRSEHFDSLPELLAFLGRTVRVAEGLRFNEGGEGTNAGPT